MRRRFPGKGLVNAVVDLPLALSPVVVGLALFLLYGRGGWLGGWLEDHGIQVLFALPAMVLATIFVSLPFVVREVVPACARSATSRSRRPRRSARRGWQTFRRDHAARDPLGGRLRRRPDDRALPRRVRRGRASSPAASQGKTETATLRVEERSQSFDVAGAYALSSCSRSSRCIVLVAMTLIRAEGADV